jgi:hypothetical protein
MSEIKRTSRQWTGGKKMSRKTAGCYSQTQRHQYTTADTYITTPAPRLLGTTGASRISSHPPAQNLTIQSLVDAVHWLLFILI